MATNKNTTCPSCGEQHCQECGSHEDFAEKYIGDMGVSWMYNTFVRFPFWLSVGACLIFIHDLWRVVTFVPKVAILYWYRKQQAKKSKAQQAEEEVEFLDAGTPEKAKEERERIQARMKDNDTVRKVSPTEVQTKDGEWIDIGVE